MDEPGRVRGLAFARWWAVCSVCHGMLLAETAEIESV